MDITSSHNTLQFFLLPAIIEVPSNTVSTSSSDVVVKPKVKPRKNVNLFDGNTITFSVVGGGGGEESKTNIKGELLNRCKLISK